MDKIEIPFKEIINDGSGEVIKTTGVEQNEILYSLNHDSRNIERGQWFICLRGEAGDGHEYIVMAVEKGACGIIYESGNDVSFLDPHVKTIEVKDTTHFLGTLARRWRDLMNPVIIAITGSNGKTSTKEMVAFLLGHAYPGKVFYSRGNWNNHFGLPFSLLNLRTEHEYAVIEVGTNHPGEIEYLAKIARPDYSIVTSVASGHIGNFGSVENISEEKSSIVEGMDGGFLSMPETIAGRETFETKAAKHNVEVIFSDQQLNKIPSGGVDTHFQYHDQEYILPLPGAHQFENFKLAVSILVKVGLTQEVLMDAFSDLKTLSNVPGRLAQRDHSDFIIW
ncbi:MAG: UDP-N-acetylmuramoyl-tripeptide--D-alanyl-D-alanine ligase, partial [Leptospirales bacterium]